MASTADLAQLVQRLENVAVKLESTLGAKGSPAMEGTGDTSFVLVNPSVCTIW